MLAKKIAYNTITSVVSKVLSTALALMIIGLMTRSLGQDGFGRYSTILAFLYIFSVLADLGLYSIAVREISKTGAAELEIANQAFSLRFWAGFLIFGLAPLVGLFFPYSVETKIGIALAAGGQWLLSNSQVLMAVFQKYLRIDKAALADTASRVVQLVLVFFAINRNWGFLSFILTFTASCLVNFLLVWLFVQKYVPLRLTWNPGYWRRMLKESFPLALSAIFVMIYFKLDTVMLSVMKPPADVGIYSAAYKILENLIFFPAMFVGLFMPMLSKYALDNRAEFKKISQKVFEFLLIFAIPLAVGGLILSSPIIKIVAGSGFLAAGGVLKILILATSVIFFSSLFSNMIVALEKQKALAKIYALGAIVNFSVNLILIPRFSYWGAASSTLFTELLVAVLMTLVIRRAADYVPRFGLSAKVFLAALAMALALWWLQGSNIFLLILLGSSIYFVFLFALRVLSVKETVALISRRYD